MNNTNEIGYRPTWAEVNLGNLAHNYAQVKKTLSPATKIMACVKADAYGHGIIPVSRRLACCGVDYFGVASIDEGIKLREAGINVPILILGVALKNAVEPLFKFNLTPTVCCRDFAAALDLRARSLERRIKVHIKVDTGMGRIGILHDDALKLIQGIRKLKFVDIEGIFTHFAVADMDKEFTLHQIDLFNGLIARLHKLKVYIPLVHAANSMGVLGYKKSHFNMVRPGLIIYGLYPKKNLRIKLKPVLSLKSRVVYSKVVPARHGISYGHDYVTDKKTRIVTLPIGYGDGYPRNLTNKAPVLIKGRRFTVSGKICMDQIMVDVGNLSVRAGEEVILIGAQGAREITAEELARLGGTIPYEIVCGLGSRIPRIYLDTLR